jgi:hypothetical protein
MRTRMFNHLHKAFCNLQMSKNCTRGISSFVSNFDGTIDRMRAEKT